MPGRCAFGRGALRQNFAEMTVPGIQSRFRRNSCAKLLERGSIPVERPKMYDLVLKPVAIVLVVLVTLFAFHLLGPTVASGICPSFEETRSDLTSRCEQFFDILK